MMKIREPEPSEEGAGRAKAITRRRVVFALIARVLPWLRFVSSLLLDEKSTIIIQNNDVCCWGGMDAAYTPCRHGSRDLY